MNTRDQLVEGIARRLLPRGSNDNIELVAERAALVAEVLRLLEYGAVDRAKTALLDVTPGLRDRYAMDVIFHALMEAVVQIVVAGVFGDDLTTDERRMREHTVMAFHEKMTDPAVLRMISGG